MRVNQIVAVLGHGIVDEFSDALDRQAGKEFVFEFAASAPGHDAAACRCESRLKLRCGLLIVITDKCYAVAEFLEGLRPLDRPVGVAAARIYESNALRRDSGTTRGRFELIDAPNEADLGCAFAHEDRRGKERLGIEPNRTLDVIIGSHAAEVVTIRPAAKNEQLVTFKFAQDDGRMRRHEHLQGWTRFLCSQGSQEPDNAMWLKTVLKLVDQNDSGTLGRLPLEARDQ